MRSLGLVVAALMLVALLELVIWRLFRCPEAASFSCKM